MRVEPQQLIAFLLDAGLAKQDQLDAAKKEAERIGAKLETVLTKNKIVSEEEVIKLKAYILGIPYVNLEKEVIPPDVLQIVPEPIAKKYNIVAFRKQGRDLEVAMTDPEDLQTIEFIHKKADLNILPRLTNSESISSALKQYQQSIDEEFSQFFGEKKERGDVPEEDEDSFEGKIISIPKEEEGQVKAAELVKAAEDLPVVKIVDSLLRHAIVDGASDIHIEPAEKEVIVRYRVDGILRDAMTLPKKLQQGIVARIKVLSSELLRQPGFCLRRRGARGGSETGAGQARPAAPWR